MIATYNVLQDLNTLLDAFSDTTARDRFELSEVQYKEGNDIIQVRYFVPGAVNDNIDLQLENNNLKLTFNKKQDEGEKRYIRRERSHGTFTKTVKLPYRVDHEKIGAELKNGVLTVTLEKSEDARPKKIEIV
jgi:HSP20 family protein